ncbi:GH17300 [Drosophila grimshawi]|uniref:GH17300 n=1 Tax=Drosophila grimshawi TaxID=7222 RepID=B4JUJ0_DROGR|nr:GH17300 [Drosophila grimshawi]
MDVFRPGRTLRHTGSIEEDRAKPDPSTANNHDGVRKPGTPDRTTYGHAKMMGSGYTESNETNLAPPVMKSVHAHYRKSRMHSSSSDRKTIDGVYGIVSRQRKSFSV